MLLCDGCGRGWHAGCLPQPPPRAPAPADEWLCTACAAGAPRANPWQPPVAVGGEPLAWARSFTYLGSVIHETASIEPELSRRIQLAAAAFHALQRPVFQQSALSVHVRLRVYRALVQSVLTYGCEGWALNQQQLQRLGVFHRQCIRTIVGLRRADRVSNAALHDKYNIPTIEAVLRQAQGRWLGHVARMPDARITKQAMYSCRVPGGAPSASRRASLTEHYRALAASIPRSVVRACGATWCDVAANRGAWESALRATPAASLNETQLQRRQSQQP
jgi:hypothetical protein